MKIKTLRNTLGWQVIMLVFIMLAAFAAFSCSLMVGAVKVSFPDFIDIFFHSNIEHPYRDILWNIRLPRTIVGALVGANLALAGLLLQGVMRNPLADPHIIGVSSGAGLFGMTILVIFPHLTSLVTPLAFIGAMGAAILIYLLSWKNGIVPTRVILAGVAVSAFFGSGISALMTFYSDRVQGALSFMVGGLAAKSWPQVETILPYSIIGILFSLLLVKKLNIIKLGDSVAKGLGMRVEVVRLIITATAALLAASSVSVVGLLGFVGLIVPHICRLLIGNDYRVLLPATACLGIAVVTISDTFGRILFSPFELPVGVIMGALGGPFFLFLLRRKSVS